MTPEQQAAIEFFRFENDTYLSYRQGKILADALEAAEQEIERLRGWIKEARDEEWRLTEEDYEMISGKDYNSSKIDAEKKQFDAETESILEPPTGKEA